MEILLFPCSCKKSAFASCRLEFKSRMSQQPECISEFLSEFLSDFYSSVCKKTLWSAEYNCKDLAGRGVADADLNPLLGERLRAVTDIVLYWSQGL